MRNVIVTGGTRGLGLAIVRRLTAAGFRAIAIGRRESEEFAAAKQEALESYLQAPNAGVRDDANPLPLVAFDLEKIEAIPELVKRLREEFGPLYGLVNNAGASVEGLLAMTSTEQIEGLVRLNTVSPIVLTKHVVRAMMADRIGGRIVNIASITASSGYSGLSVYSATKASLVGFTRSLARELGRAGVNVNAVAPGFVSTEMTRGMRAEARQQIERRSALKRLAEADDVAGAVEYLLSESAKNITGTVLTVDAGATA